ncbi:hypothetical protein OTU49_009469 [Cherax quadricarinatus]|uniref:Dol-P-Glc:Glc(2)Man(9)GlcNAc(2)-PP-Dol alpha-1,2-glucosyltransferase n=1 Tax=Cherax quadricarinatus TaxID=27406 RepID=A0AAW0Y8D1_CHEQU
MGTPQPSFIFPLVILTFTAVSYVFFVVVYTVQPTPFIDEIFHIPQAQKYCEGSFLEWDPKITTLPGLYLFSIGLNGPVSWVLGHQLCDVFSLRITNLVAAAFMLFTLHKLLIHLHKDKALMKKLKKTAAKPYRLAEVLVDVMADCFSYGLVLACFLVFVMYNGSIVVGDRSAHEATVHLPQLGYFFLFFIIFSLPYAPSHVRPFIKLCRRHLALAVAVLVVSVMVVHSNTLVHPYLLADNRHLTFYLWNKLYGRFSVIRYLMVPVYMFGAYMVHTFIQHRSFVFKALFVACLAASVVPHKLLEFRYFIIPFLLARMQNVSRNWWQLWIETLYFLLINTLTLYLFVSKTFMWDDSPELQRIIW